MKNILLLIAFFISGHAPAHAEAGPLTKAGLTGEAQIWATRVKTSDVGALETLLSPNYLHTHGTGKVETKEQFLEALRTGSRKYERCEMTDLRVILLGQGGVVQGTLDVKAVTKGKTLEVVNRFMMVFAKTERGWEVIAFQATPTEKKE